MTQKNDNLRYAIFDIIWKQTEVSKLHIAEDAAEKITAYLRPWEDLLETPEEYADRLKFLGLTSERKS